MAAATSIECITAELRALGLGAGDVVMVHASLRKLGTVQNGATGVIEAILRAIGDTGTMMMVLGAVTTEPFDAARTPVDTKEMGALAEVFRTHPGVLVNDHASDRFAAIGPRAEFLLANPPLHHYLGPGSPLDHLAQARGRVLRLGADIDTVTLTHLAEYLADLPAKRSVRRLYHRSDIGEQWIESLDDCDGIVDWSHGDYFSQILRTYLATEEVAVGTVGSCTAELLDAQRFLDFATSWMEAHLA